MTFEIKVDRIGNNLRIIIPREIADHLQLRKGNTVKMWVDNKHIHVEKKQS